MPPALVPVLLGILEKLGQVAYDKAVELVDKWQSGKAITKGDYLAISAGALQGSYDQDYTAARDRAEKAAAGL